MFREGIININDDNVWFTHSKDYLREIKDAYTRMHM